jgi:hypothetical protein
VHNTHSHLHHVPFAGRASVPMDDVLGGKAGPPGPFTTRLEEREDDEGALAPAQQGEPKLQGMFLYCR